MKIYVVLDQKFWSISLCRHIRFQNRTGLFVWKCLILFGWAWNSKIFPGQGHIFFSWYIFSKIPNFHPVCRSLDETDTLPGGRFCIDFVNKILRFWDRLVLVCQYVQSVLKVILGKSSFPTSGVIKFLLTPIGEIRLTSNSYDY